MRLTDSHFDPLPAFQPFDARARLLVFDGNIAPASGVHSSFHLELSAKIRTLDGLAIIFLDMCEHLDERIPPCMAILFKSGPLLLRPPFSAVSYGLALDMWNMSF